MKQISKRILNGNTNLGHCYSYYAEFAQSCLWPGTAAHFLKILSLFVATHMYIYIQFIESHIIHNNPSLICL